MGQKDHFLCSVATLVLVVNASTSQAGNTMSHCVVADAGSQPQQESYRQKPELTGWRHSRCTGAGLQ
jgi:hypothetical protein